MFVVTVTFVINGSDADAFMPLIQENRRKSLDTEPGCHRFDICRTDDRPAEIFLYELYDDEAAFEAHKASAHYLAFAEKTEGMVAGKTVNTFTLVSTD